MRSPLPWKTSEGEKEIKVIKIMQRIFKVEAEQCGRGKIEGLFFQQSVIRLQEDVICRLGKWTKGIKLTFWQGGRKFVWRGQNKKWKKSHEKRVGADTIWFQLRRKYQQIRSSISFSSPRPPPRYKLDYLQTKFGSLGNLFPECGWKGCRGRDKNLRVFFQSISLSQSKNQDKEGTPPPIPLWRMC